ncbi:hypothetical protein ASPVEDRAFT_123545 [Aspergillus versicolor CBS 583.65]|uniref:Uncharacterized protein n=1 Tax=Aspergillus versicolor CBS 583.65 TaxID=1036611 RepID=A0A1L9PDI4_ASPVE|nr:uncharacterized protein ASPVEDRAFT_123545 [Aspergillus versicolor CBS 583.65]OJI99558.1 hypothetical protein ASPVEDRAFT_123545 [Aspergillus versicolor CBS 583.65]
MSDSIKADVFISGGGPVGLLIAYSLALQGVDAVLVEQRDKTQQAMYGRATTLYPRTLEMLDQLQLLDELNQIGYVARNSITYDKDGRRVTSRGWHLMFERMHGTFLDYCLNIRQKFSENVIRDAFKSIGGEPYIGWKLEGFSIDDAAEDEYKVVSNIVEVNSGRKLVVRSKYIVGADGGHSLVRRLANIPLDGDQTEFKWVRIDGRFKTNMPDSDLGFASIESENHGNVLWVQLDHGVKRIGFALTEEMLAKYEGKFGLEVAKAEATKSMAPYSLQFESIEWWTLYSISQRVAETFFSNDRILLAGDACHTHSSGAAQGMNTGIHDAVNLSWKIGGAVKGWYNASKVLATYDAERRPAAQHLIDLDKTFSATISGRVPEAYKSLALDANALFSKVFDDTIQFNIGLGINYDANIINKSPKATMTTSGWRAPDALVYAPGSRIPTRLFRLTNNTGVWSVIVFAGRPDRTQPYLAGAVQTLGDLSASVPDGMIRFFTLVSQPYGGGDQVFDIPKVGKLYFDSERSAHTAYAASDTTGCIAVVRPDGILGCATRLDDVDSISGYFKKFTTLKK